MIDNAIFEDLQAKIDEETAVRDELHDIVQTLAKKGRSTQAILARAHSTPSDQLKPILDAATREIIAQRDEVSRLRAVADKHPFYKYNGVWTRELQNLVTSIELCAWLGGLEEFKGAGSASFLTIEEVGKFLDIPVNLKEKDAFHLTIEEYLLALISMVEELSRLVVNSVTLGDYNRPVQIGKFIKDLFGGFQLLNLKNDILRKRSDGIKYSVKKVEDVVYDLSLRNLIPKGSAAA
ncbi:translin [Aspergillus clavatus NRRL 1]|uniref:Recombination hotspot-binding protein (Translin), putative n=1 Tax=Aspergillus clavatus (strain ATCC 1007 / CBS 513.65 / DSM 816 / NCTC 3887 / NRRL 1 / QM 1276 / 107) TaxID=344612 RepID=A1CKX5_ASPCL|nr:recombination hotspot-binding protein (Translin), putative [Aspergillus clavatus NRRL 1]EAW09799.1 recombination hotspot-binding protein (Translin), putative [Aspergillus clavatus NRRL 1]